MTAIVEKYVPPAVNEPDISPEVVKQFAILKVEALICLRMAVKMNENEQKMQEQVFLNSNEEMVSVIESLCKEIYLNILLARNEIFDSSFDTETQQMRAKMDDYCTYVEMNIISSCQWNLNLPKGPDQLISLLKLSNLNYDFKVIVSLTSKCALDLIFYNLPGSKFSFSGPQQSSILMKCLEVVCKNFGWDSFFDDFISYVEEQGLGNFIPNNET